MSTVDTITKFQQYAVLGAELSGMLAATGAESAHTNQAVLHVAQVVTNPTIPAALSALTNAHNAGGEQLYGLVFAGIASLFPHLFPGVQIVPVAPPTGPQSVLALPQQ